MQRRAAAIYFVFFLVIGAGAWAYIGVAEDTHDPQFSVTGTSFESGTNGTIDGVTYSAGELANSEGTLTWQNESGIETATIENDSTLTYENASYRALVPSEANATSFTLDEELNVSAILAADTAVENETATYNDTEQVVYRDNQSLRPLAAYLPDPNRVELSEGDSMPYEEAEYTVESVGGPGGVTLERTTTIEEEVDLQEGGNVTLAGGSQYFAHFPTNSTVEVVPIDRYPQYADTVADREYLDERIAGLWGVVIVSLLAAILLLASAYMPVRG